MKLTACIYPSIQSQSIFYIENMYISIENELKNDASEKVFQKKKCELLFF